MHSKQRLIHQKNLAAKSELDHDDLSLAMVAYRDLIRLGFGSVLPYIGNRSQKYTYTEDAVSGQGASTLLQFESSRILNS